MNPKKSRKPSLNNYARYTGIAFQMLAIILLGVYAGLKLDGWVKWNIPVFTILMSLFAVVIAIYTVTKDLMKNK